MSIREQTAARTPRELTGRMVLLCLVGFFGVVAAANGLMMHFAVATFGGVETASSYKAGLAFAQELAQADAQEARHWRVDAAVLPGPAGGTRIDVSARDADGRFIPGLSATLRFAHPADRRLDRDLTMDPAGIGRFAATTADRLAGHWILVIELERDGQRLFRSTSRTVIR